MSLRHTIRTGIEVENIPGLVPLLDVINACNSSNYKFFGDWQELDDSQKALLTAVYYTNKFIQGHQQDAESDEQLRRAKKAKGGKGR